MKIRIAEIPAQFLDRVRNKGLDDLGQPVRRYRSESGGEPCRDVLRRARPGEELILASYCPFPKQGPFKEYGPIYVLAEPNSEMIQRDELLPPQSKEEEYFVEQFVLRAYNHDQDIIDAALVTKPEADAVLHRFLDATTVAYVHARFPFYGCFACHIDRE